MFPAGWRQAPPEIETERLLLRCPREKDGPQLYCAISESLPELRPWFTWAANLIPTADNCRFAAALARERFLSGQEMQFYIFASGEKKLAGVCGLLRPDWTKRTFEIYYWLRSCSMGNGYMVEAAIGVTQFALKNLAAIRIEARCDPANEKGIAVAQRAGYILEKRVISDLADHSHGERADIALLVHLT